MIAADSVPKPTADWERVGERYYRKTQLYTSVFDEELELENYRIAGAPYGGALGNLRSLPYFWTYPDCLLQHLYETKTAFTPIEVEKQPKRASTSTAAPAS